MYSTTTAARWLGYRMVCMPSDIEWYACLPCLAVVLTAPLLLAFRYPLPVILLMLRLPFIQEVCVALAVVARVAMSLLGAFLYLAPRHSCIFSFPLLPGVRLLLPPFCCVVLFFFAVGFIPVVH